MSNQITVEKAPIVIRKVETLRGLISFDQFGEVRLSKGAELKVDELVELGVAEVDGLKSGYLRAVGIIRLVEKQNPVQVGTKEAPELKSALEYAIEKIESRVTSRKALDQVLQLVQAAKLGELIGVRDPFKVQEGKGYLAKLELLPHVTSEGKVVDAKKAEREADPVFMAIKAGEPTNNGIRPKLQAARKAANEAAAKAGKEAPFPTKKTVAPVVIAPERDADAVARSIAHHIKIAREDVTLFVEKFDANVIKAALKMDENFMSLVALVTAK